MPQWSKFPIAIISFSDGSKRMKLGVGIRCDSRHFNWANKGNFEANIDFEIEILTEFITSFRKPLCGKYITRETLQLVLTNIKCRSLSIEDIFEDLKPWMDTNSFSFPSLKVMQRHKKCKICFEIFNESNIKQCSLKCSFSNVCEPCLVHWLQSKLPKLQSLTCIDKNCNGTFDIENLSKLLNPAWYKACLLGETNTNFITCSHCLIDIWYERNENKHDYFECPHCDKSTCFKCLKFAHPGRFCKIIHIPLMIDDIQNTMKCKKCNNIGILDNNACNKIQCSNCNQCIMCACCKQEIFDDYDHFCRDKESSPINCLKSHKHCYLWPNKDIMKKTEHFDLHNDNVIFDWKLPKEAMIDGDEIERKDNQKEDSDEELPELEQNIANPKKYKGGIVYHPGIHYQVKPVDMIFDLKKFDSWLTGEAIEKRKDNEKEEKWNHFQKNYKGGIHHAQGILDWNPIIIDDITNYEKFKPWIELNGKRKNHIYIPVAPRLHYLGSAGKLQEEEENDFAPRKIQEESIAPQENSEEDDWGKTWFPIFKKNFHKI